MPRYSKNHYAGVAQETLDILAKGQYSSHKGPYQDISQTLADAVEHTRLYIDDDIGSLKAMIRDKPVTYEQTVIEVVLGTTVKAIRCLKNDPNYIFKVGDQLILPGLPPQDIETSRDYLVALNFASAKNPGGGFLRGSMAQEESLALSSGLYTCLTSEQCSDYYYLNRQEKSCVYTDLIIYSRNIPFIRDDDFVLTTPYTCSIITAPAVNAKVARHRLGNNANEIINQRLKSRMLRLLSIAYSEGHSTVILGAWGTGVFANSKYDVATMFRQLLTTTFKGLFKRVIFAIPDGNTYDAFKQYIIHPDDTNPSLADGNTPNRARKTNRNRFRKARRQQKMNV